MLKLGSTGAKVRTLQALLKADGARITVDGWFGPATHAAVRDAQRRYGLVVDGIAGPKTIAALQADHRTPRHLSALDLVIAAQDLGVPLAAVRAVNEVESRGAGFLPDGRPVILYERHIMHRRLKARGVQPDTLADLVARHPDLINPQRGGYLGGTAEHARLTAASRIHPDAAIESCSWGLFQIMGWHWQALGYASPQRWADLMSTTEGYHLQAFTAFIRANPALHTALRELRWATFARLYNGPDYRANLYDVRLARAYARYALEGDTPGTAATAIAVANGIPATA